MPREIDRVELKRRLDRGDDFVLIEVLTPEDYASGHLPGAVNIPLAEIGHTTKERYSLDRELIVYCGSFQCQASPQAAEKLERLGFRNVWDYAGGKADWVEAGYPLEGGPSGE